MASVLVIEDDFDIREPIVELLQEEGYQTFSASNGKEAIDLLKTIAPPQLIICDLMMPQMNGAEFIQALKDLKLPGMEQVPVLILTAASDASSKVQYLATGYIKKPIDIDVLLDAVGKYTRAA